MESLTPQELVRYFTAEDVRRGTEWLVTRNMADSLNLLLDFALLVLLSVGRPGQRLWSFLEVRLQRSGTPLDRVLGSNWRTGAVFLMAVALIRNIAAFPLNFYIGYVEAHRIGLSQEGLSSYLRQYAVGVVVVLCGAAVLGGVLGAVRDRWPRRWWLILGLTAAALLWVDAAMEPLQLRLHNTFKPLPAGSLRNRLEQLLADQHADVGQILTMDASRYGTEANAFVSGYGPTRQLILTDTLLPFGDDAVMGAVAHEIGHRREQRLPFRLLLAGVAMVGFLWLVERTLRFASARGAPNSAQGLPLVRLLVLLILLLTSPVRMALNRAEEREADALELSVRHDYEAYIAEQVRLARANASAPEAPAWIRPFMSHPSPAERIASALRYQAVSTAR